ncbi:hypothetical protein [Arthrobacter sp. GAS37]
MSQTQRRIVRLLNVVAGVGEAVLRLLSVVDRIMEWINRLSGH